MILSRTCRVVLAAHLAGCAASDPASGDQEQQVVQPPPPATGSTTNGSATGSNPGPTPGMASGSLPSNPSSGTPGAPTAGQGAGATDPMPLAGAPSASAGSDAPAVPPTPRGTSTCLLPGNGDYNAPGPYKVVKTNIDLGMIEATQATGKFTIYHPESLEAECLHPIVAWGNGTGVTDSDFTYDFLNSNAASWGMVVASSSETNSGSGNFHKAGLDYLLAQNADPSSPFYGKLSTRAGVSGHSQGGFGANRAASHPNVETAVVEGASFVATAKVSALVLTGTADLGLGAADAVSRAAGPMFVAVWEGGDHISTETVLGFITGDKGSVQFQRLYAAWFRCFLADDGTACALFEGGAPDNCGLCSDPGWARLASANM